MPTSRPFFVTGKPEMPYLFMISWASEIFCSGATVIGSVIMPLSNFLTFSTSAACAQTERLR